MKIGRKFIPVTSILGFAFFTLLAVTPPAFSACDFDWKPGEPVPGVDGTVYAMTTWDPDGAGPQPALLVVGGSFTMAGGIPANNIAAWDGTNWQSLGNGTNNDVLALAVYNNQLIAAGDFNSVGAVNANYIASWNGSSWQSLGLGTDDSVYALAVNNGLLYVGGDFYFAGGIDVEYVASWNGSSWQMLDRGTDDTVYALAVYNGQLYAGGDFEMAGGHTREYIASWDGAAWQAVGNGTDDSVYALAVYNNQLYAGGDFWTAGAVDANYIAIWNGTKWQTAGDGTDDTVYAMAVYNNQLYAGGDFWYAGNAAANYIASWDGSTWQSLAHEVDDSVYALTVYNNQLYAGGDFTAADNKDYNYIAGWNASSWQPLGTGLGSFVGALTVYDGQLVIGGSFYSVNNISLNMIAGWGGSSWQPIGSGMNNLVSALTVYDSNLVAAGVFTQAGNTDANRIAEWSGTSWQPLGRGTNGAINAVTVYKSNLIAGGAFTIAGGAGRSRIAMWDGSGWLPLGTGINGAVNTLAVYNDDLIAGGTFTLAGGIGASNVARWNGSGWQSLGSGTNAAVSALAVYENHLIAGGSFTTAGGANASYIAAWDGNSWQNLGSGMNGAVKALTVYDCQLIAGGIFTTADGASAEYIAQWDGTTWQPFAGGMNGEVDALAVCNGELVIAGKFTMAADTISGYVARWGLPTFYRGDLNFDCIVNETDLGLLAGQWLEGNCESAGSCNQADLNYDRYVNLIDYAIFANQWLNDSSHNQPPFVNAGSYQEIALPASAALDGTVIDDGKPNPPAAVTTLWAKQSGPGTVAFTNTNAIDTTASFSAVGTYVLRLTANDGELQGHDDVTITVLPPQPPPSPASISYPTSSNTWDYTVNWPASSEANSYQVERSNNNGVSWGQVYSDANTVYAEVVGSGSYRYRVKATNAYGSSGWLTGTYNCVVSIPAPPAWSESADYYIDTPSGTDNGAGTSSQPFKTLTKAVSSATAGKKVLVWGSRTYSGYLLFTTSGTSASPITFKRDPASGEAVINGNGINQGVLQTTTAGYIVIDGFKLTNAKFGAHLSGDTCDGWIIKNCRVTANSNHGLFLEQGDNNLFFNNAIYLNDIGNSGVEIENTALNNDVVQCSIYKQDVGVFYRGSCTGGKVKDCIITNNVSFGIRVYSSSSATITYCDVWNNSTSPSTKNYSNCTAGTGCISPPLGLDPLFLSPDVGDFHLGAGSPAHNHASDGGDIGYRYSSSAL